ncbi:hypothetical protein C8Q79DRAFT_986777 [Trametes meyenii]|nr:hypothetical protein C8Q79DRAFT_986777 [Trametes meyenii]
MGCLWSSWRMPGDRRRISPAEPTGPASHSYAAVGRDVHVHGLRVGLRLRVPPP